VADVKFAVVMKGAFLTVLQNLTSYFTWQLALFLHTTTSRRVWVVNLSGKVYTIRSR